MAITRIRTWTVRAMGAALVCALCACGTQDGGAAGEASGVTAQAADAAAAGSDAAGSDTSQQADAAADGSGAGESVIDAAGGSAAGIRQGGQPADGAAADDGAGAGTDGVLGGSRLEDANGAGGDVGAEQTDSEAEQTAQDQAAAASEDGDAAKTQDGGDGAQSGSDGAKDASQGSAVSAQALYDSIQAAVALPEMYRADDAYILNYYGIDASGLTDYVFAASDDATRADTVALMTLRDAADASAYASRLQALKEQLATEMQDYLPAQYDVVVAAQVRSVGDHVYLVISPDAAAIERVIRDAWE